MLQPYIEDGFVELIDWPSDFVKLKLDSQQRWLVKEDTEAFISSLTKCRRREQKRKLEERRRKLGKQDETEKEKEKPHPQTDCQQSAFSDAYARHRDYTWVGAFDVDEFFVPMDPSLPPKDAIHHSFRRLEKESLCTYLRIDSIVFWFKRSCNHS